MSIMNDELSLDSGWRIGEESFATLVANIESVSASVIVEFGAGASSIRLAKTFPDAEIHALEHDPAFAEETSAMQRAYGVENLTVHFRPIRWQVHGGCLYQCYAPGSFPSEIDVVIIDGPPYFVHLGREACLYQVADRLRVGGLVMLDDCNRKVEQSAVDSWLSSFPGRFERKDLAVGHGLCVLKNLKRCRRSSSWSGTIGNYLAAAARFRRALKTPGSQRR